MNGGRWLSYLILLCLLTIFYVLIGRLDQISNSQLSDNETMRQLRQKAAETQQENRQLYMELQRLGNVARRLDEELYKMKLIEKHQKEIKSL